MTRNVTKDHERVNKPPKYKIGQAVVVIVHSKDDKSGMEFQNKVNGWILSIIASGTSEKDTYEYGITVDMPGCYYNGESAFTRLYEDDVELLTPKE